MAANFKQVSSLDRLDELFTSSHEHPVVLFKHSNTCGISLDVFEQISQINGEINIIVVQQNRDISNAVADRLGIRHASPQAFVLWRGEPIYHATHYGIAADTIEEKLRAE